MLGFDAYLIEIYIHEFFRLDLDDEGNLLTSSMLLLLHPLQLASFLHSIMRLRRAMALYFLNFGVKTGQNFDKFEEDHQNGIGH